VKNHDFTPKKKIIFLPILGGGGARAGCAPPESAPALNDCDGEHIINQKYIADIFNNHFVNITENMDLNPDTNITYIEKLDNYISDRIPENIFFNIPLCQANMYFNN
jgi:hypothetical protein